MSVRIGHASIDENGKISGGSAGDQSGREVVIRNWYSKPWTYVLRCRDSEIAEKMAKACEAACANDCIGYDQYQRTTLYKQALEKVHDLSKITTPCECDCSSLMCECAIVAGVNVAYDLTTSTMKNAFVKTGKFEVLTDKKYTQSEKYLKRGDILLTPGSHTAMVLDNGDGSLDKTPKIRAAQSFDKGFAGKYRVEASLMNVRSGPGTEYEILTVLKNGDTVRCYGYYDGGWLYVVVNDSTDAWVSRKWLRKV